eukprot:Pgem_evm1s106
MEISGEYSHTEAQTTMRTVSSSMSHSVTDTFVAKCEARPEYHSVALYQFYMNAEQNTISGKEDAHLFSNVYRCVYGNMRTPPEPKCIPDLCKDEFCQTCCQSIAKC